MENYAEAMRFAAEVEQEYKQRQEKIKRLTTENSAKHAQSKNKFLDELVAEFKEAKALKKREAKIRPSLFKLVDDVNDIQKLEKINALAPEMQEVCVDTIKGTFVLRMEAYLYFACRPKSQSSFDNRVSAAANYLAAKSLIGVLDSSHEGLILVIRWLLNRSFELYEALESEDRVELQKVFPDFLKNHVAWAKQRESQEIDDAYQYRIFHLLGNESYNEKKFTEVVTYYEKILHGNHKNIQLKKRACEGIAKSSFELITADAENAQEHRIASANHYCAFLELTFHHHDRISLEKLASIQEKLEELNEEISSVSLKQRIESVGPLCESYRKELAQRDFSRAFFEIFETNEVSDEKLQSNYQLAQLGCVGSTLAELNAKNDLLQEAKKEGWKNRDGILRGLLNKAKLVSIHALDDGYSPLELCLFAKMLLDKYSIYLPPKIARMKETINMDFAHYYNTLSKHESGVVRLLAIFVKKMYERDTGLILEISDKIPSEDAKKLIIKLKKLLAKPFFYSMMPLEDKQIYGVHLGQLETVVRQKFSVIFEKVEVKKEEAPPKTKIALKNMQSQVEKPISWLPEEFKPRQQAPKAESKKESGASTEESGPKQQPLKAELKKEPVSPGNSGKGVDFSDLIAEGLGVLQQQPKTFLAAKSRMYQPAPSNVSSQGQRELKSQDNASEESFNTIKEPSPLLEARKLLADYAEVHGAAALKPGKDLPKSSQSSSSVATQNQGQPVVSSSLSLN